MPVQPDVQWRVVICDILGAAITTVDGIASQKTLTYRLNQPASMSFTVPGDDKRINIVHTDGDPYIAPASRIVKAYRLESGVWTLRFAGPIFIVEDSGDDEKTQTMVTAFDPSQLLHNRLVRTSGGAVNTVTYTATAGNTIAKDFVDRTISGAGGCFIQTTGTFASTTAQTTTFEEGMSVGEALERLTATNTMDVLFDPVDGVSGVFATMGVSAARGSAKPAAVFGYGTANYAVKSIRRTLDATQLANDVRVAGGRPLTGATWTTGNATDSTSITKYNRYESWDAVDPDVTNSTYLGTLASVELGLRKQPREFVSITPFPQLAPAPFNDYFLGDTIQVWTSSNLRQAITGSQRVYQLTVTVDDDGFESVGEIVASPNG